MNVFILFEFSMHNLEYTILNTVPHAWIYWKKSLKMYIMTASYVHANNVGRFQPGKIITNNKLNQMNFFLGKRTIIFLSDWIKEVSAYLL